MKTLKLIGMVPLLIAASTFAQDDRAVPRGSGGGSSDAGSRHTGGSSSGSSTSSSSAGESGRSGSSASGGSYDNSGSYDAAQRRPRPGTGSGTRDRYGNDRDTYRSYPYSSYYYDPYYYSWGYPGSRRYGLGYGYGYYDYGFSYGDYYGYYPPAYSRSYRYRSGNISQVRTLVEPAQTRIYVDGYYAGIADDFDGLLQRLNVSPGRHEITLRLDGYRSHTFSIYANRDQTLKLRWDMVKGSGETRDSVGEERPSDRDRADEDRDFDRREREMDRDRDGARSEPGREVDSDRPYTPPTGGSRGEVLLEVEPRDASIYVDGEFYGKAAQLTRLELSPGRHRIEVVRPGYKTQETEVNVEGEAKRVVIKLDRR